MQVSRVNGVVGVVLGSALAYLIGQWLIDYGALPAVLGILAVVAGSLSLTR